MTTVLLITTPPYHRQGVQALNMARSLLQSNQEIKVFFYGDGAYIANRLCWQPAHIPNPAQEWIALAKQYNFALPVCVSAALARGVCDDDNAKRHGLEGENLLKPFELVGLSEFATMLMKDNIKLLQF